MMKQMVIKGSHGLFDVFLGPFRSGLVVLHDSKTRENPSASSWENIGIGKIKPLHDLGLKYGVLSSSELFIGNIVCNGIALEKA